MLNFESLLRPALLLFGGWVLFQLINKINRTLQIRSLSKDCGQAVRWKYWDPIFGFDYLWGLYSDYSAHKFLEGAVKRYANLKTNTICMSTLWGPPTYSTIEPENLKVVLATKFKDYNLDQQRKKALQPIIGHGIFSTDGEVWQHSRDLLKPPFTRAKIDDPTCYEAHAEDLVKAILAKIKTDEIVDLQPLFSHSSLDIITEFLFGDSSWSLDPANEGKKTEGEKFYDAFRYIVSSYDGSNSNLGALSLFLPDSGVEKNRKIMNAYLDSVIDRAIADEKALEGRDTLLAGVVKTTQDRPRLRTEMLNVLLAGRDTTESFMSSLFFTLSQRPDIFSKLQAEIDNSDIPFAPNFSQLKSLPYLRACLNEVQRLYPSAPENERQAIADTYLPLGGGPDQKQPIFVKKDSVVHWSTFALHRRKDLYGEDAEDFRPERWIDTPEKKGLRVNWEYIPFNGGPRVCIGQQFALMQVSYLTVRLMRAFEKIEKVEPGPWVEAPSIAVTVLGGVKVRITPRK